MKLLVEGHHLEARWIGPAPEAAPTLVFLHEGLGSIAQWRDFPDRLAEATGCGALVYDRLGYGRSDPVSLPRPLDYMQDEGRRVLPAVLDAAGVREAILFGHSDGGSIALVHASSGSPRIRALVLEAAHVFCEDVSVASITRAREAYEQGDLRARLAKYHDDVDGAFRGWSGAWLDPAFRAWNLESFLPGIVVPTLIVQGEDDPYGTLAQVEAIARGVRGEVERLIIPRCGHSPHREHQDLVIERVANFMARAGARECEA